MVRQTTNRNNIGKKCAAGKVLLCRKRPASWTTPCGPNRIRHPKTHRCRKTDRYPRQERNRLRYQQLRWNQQPSQNSRKRKRQVADSSSASSASRKRLRPISSSPSSSVTSPRSATPALAMGSPRSFSPHFSPNQSSSPRQRWPSPTITRQSSSNTRRSTSSSIGAVRRRSSSGTNRTPKKVVKKRGVWPARKGPKNAKRIQEMKNYKV